MVRGRDAWRTGVKTTNATHAVFVRYAAVAYHLGVLRRVAFIDRRVFGILSH